MTFTYPCPRCKRVCAVSNADGLYVWCIDHGEVFIGKETLYYYVEHHPPVNLKIARRKYELEQAK